MAQVSLGEVGIIFSYELSRLSRTDKDWCQLFEICPLVNTLVADEQHIYDVTIADDQLVLGIKGSISVMELRTLKARLLRVQEEKAKRGELHRSLKPGFMKDLDGRIVKDPDKRVQDAIALVFARFRASGTVRQTFKWFRDEKVELPVNRFRYGRCELCWQIPRLGYIADVLGNPIFAGAYVYGRRQRELVIVDGKVTKRDGAPRRPEQCRVFLRHHHPGYITWETFEENQQMIRRNNMPSLPVAPNRFCRRWPRIPGSSSPDRHIQDRRFFFPLLLGPPVFFSGRAAVAGGGPRIRRRRPS